LALKVYEELFLKIRQLSVFKAELFSAGIAVRLHPFHQSGGRAAKVGATRAEEIEELSENLLGGDDPYSTKALANADRKVVCLVSGIEQGDPVEGIGENAAH
jgi:hypothetical protein